MRPPEYIHDTTPYQEPEEHSFVIDKNVPLPEDMRNRTSKYPWGALDVGKTGYLNHVETSAKNNSPSGSMLCDIV